VLGVSVGSERPRQWSVAAGAGDRQCEIAWSIASAR